MNDRGWRRAFRLAAELIDPMPEVGHPRYEAERAAALFEGRVPPSAEVVDEARRRGVE